MKKWLIVLLLLACPLSVSAQDRLLEEQAEVAGIPQLNQQAEKLLFPYTQDLAPDLDMDRLTRELFRGQWRASPGTILQKILYVLLQECYDNLAGMILLLLLALLCGLLTQLGESVQHGAQTAAFYVCYAVICAMCARMFQTAIQGGTDAIHAMSEFVTVATPVFATLLGAAGQFTGAAIFQPVLYGAATLILSLTGELLIPLISAIFVLCTVNCISTDFSLSKLCTLLQKAVKWMIGMALTVFSGISVIYSLTSGTLDTLGSRTIKFAIGNFIPLVGGMLADSFELVLSCSAILKKGVGVAGMVVILLLFAGIAVKLVAQLWLFRLGAALMQPVSDKRIVALLDHTADCISLLFSLLCMCALLFLIILVMLICMGNVSVL